MLRAGLAVALLLAAPSHGATLITLGDFDDPLIEDFEGVPTGAILGTDPIFAALGITGITATPFASEAFDNRSTSTRALGATAADTLAVVDPGTSGVTVGQFGFTFASPLQRIGFGIHDSQGTMTVDFLSGMSVVDTINVTINVTITQGGQLTTVLLEADAPFGGIDLSINNGFVIDNLTVEKTEVPLPATLPLALLGLAGLGLLARRNTRGMT